jgi:ATP-binding cassette subfamily C protein
MTGEATGGIMIAASILSSRALAPIEAAIASAKSFLAARQSWARLQTALRNAPAEIAAFVPPRPAKRLSTDNLAVKLAGSTEPTLAQIGFSLDAGQCLAVLGAGGSGKSTLLRAIVGLLKPISGSVRLDGTQVSHWPSAERGSFIGYLPQQVALFEGTIAQNIGRFDPEATSESVIRAARAAGVHEMVSRLPNGYLTQLGPAGIGLSGGQTQRIGLARALYGEPFLVVLDEPSSNSDAEGDAALLRAVAQLRQRGSIVVVATHGHVLLAAATHALVLANGRQHRFGPRDEVLKRPEPEAIPKVHHAA